MSNSQDKHVYYKGERTLKFLVSFFNFLFVFVRNHSARSVCRRPVFQGRFARYARVAMLTDRCCCQRKLKILNKNASTVYTNATLVMYIHTRANHARHKNYRVVQNMNGMSFSSVEPALVDFGLQKNYQFPYLTSSSNYDAFVINPKLVGNHWIFMILSLQLCTCCQSYYGK